MEDIVFTTPPVPQTRKIAKATKKNIPPEERAAILQSVEPRKIAQVVKQVSALDLREDAEISDAFSCAARAMSDALRESIAPSCSHEEFRRALCIEQMASVLRSMIQQIRVKNDEEKAEYYPRLGDATPWVDDELVHLDPGLLAKVLEREIWQRTWEKDGDMAKYEERMEREVTDLEIWDRHFDTELEGYEMFREYFFRRLRIAGSREV